MGYRTYTCPVSRSCGGCEWLAVPYQIQLRRKQKAVDELLGPLAAADGGVIAPIVGMAKPCAYRHKCATPFAPGKGTTLRHGFYAAGTHRIVATPSCLVEHPLGRSVLNAVAAHAAKLSISAYHEDSGTGCLRHAVVRVGRTTGEALLTIVTNGRTLPRAQRLAHAIMHEFPQVVGVVQSVNTTRGNAILGRECHTIAGRATMRDVLLGCTFEIGATSFYQTNPEQTETLYRIAIAAALGNGDTAHDAVAPAPATTDPRHVMRILDAYCGCGTIGICAATTATQAGIAVRVTGVERVGVAIAAARRNAAANGLADVCTFVREDATAFLQRVAHGDASALPGGIDGDVAHHSSVDGKAGGDAAQSVALYDAIILDPPRAGSTSEFLAAVAALAPTRVVYVSCNVATQARDIQLLQGAGYRIAAVTPVDLFPHTKHVETVALLLRDGGGTRR